MGEVLILIIIALVWWFKAGSPTRTKRSMIGKTGSISASPDELIKRQKRTAEDLDALRGQTEKAPDPTEIKALHKQHRADEWERNEQRHADERAHSEKALGDRAQEAGRQRRGCILSTWTAARTGLRV